MKAIDLYLKVELDLDENEDPKRVAEELCRMLKKAHAVRRAEVSSVHDRSAE